VLGAISEFDKAMTVAKLRGARERKRKAKGKCEGRKSHAERQSRTGGAGQASASAEAEGGAQVAPGNLGRVGGPGLPQRERPPIRRNVCQIDVGTGVTRGKRLVVLVGQKKAVAIAVRNASGRRRWSKLAEWLRPPVSRRMGAAG
jgi:hypothetical protein